MIVIYLTILDFDLNPPGRLCFGLGGSATRLPGSRGADEPPDRVAGDPRNTDPKRGSSHGTGNRLGRMSRCATRRGKSPKSLGIQSHARNGCDGTSQSLQGNQTAKSARPTSDR